ncbi:hypothetical protein FJR48_06320 [Sulfurimonas lithotrophica]|uniref:Uncharacterized protein n=1 Tax=Sulfurimonas lithotrophica TaxID=2590022 RepID=A0A5P8P173_9BACT|nr:hypothetical protein [Sulfurimonas lithotrophica]QFR49361.1 hypothetical protein FJR48_06320 [Sulfurimonas lithotrophica]
MYLKRYTIASMFLMILVGWYVYAFITQETYIIEFFGLKLPSMSIAILVVAPLVILYIASMLHMSFYSFLNTLDRRKYDKDYEKFVDSIIDAFLGKEDRHNIYKTDRYELLGQLLDSSKLMNDGSLSPDTPNEKLNKVISIMEDLKNGNVVDLKKYSLDENNQLVKLNHSNMYKNSKLSAEDILNSKVKYNEELCRKVYVDFVKEAPLYAIESYSEYLTKEAMFIILSRINSDKNTLEIPNESLIKLLSGLELDVNDYVEMSKTLSLHMIPEQRIKLFEMLSEKNEEAMDAYLFTLFDLEMIDLAKEILNISQENEYLNFKSYLDLKECGKNYNIELFV